MPNAPKQASMSQTTLSKQRRIDDFMQIMGRHNLQIKDKEVEQINVEDPKIDEDELQPVQ